MRHALVAAIVLFSCEIVMSVMTGGITEQDPSKPEHMETAWKAVRHINDEASNNGPHYFVPIKVLKASTQVVAGLSTKLEVLAGESACKKGDLQAHEITKSNCNLKDGGCRAIYAVSLWEKPWENFEQFNVKKIRDVAPHETF
ncbi:unnamed protein product [Caenorhabditis bovis]|uniref:Cystatin domain-containing protein n=1 Tax=Caenorhabditis bovis TaxID=2654633 RepID=A0A8S1E4M3_9PELO|nr:unnamed protein product [Caenorhabditis bovis]